MNVENFFYWLQGAFEIADLKTICKEQAEMILRHILLVEEQTNGKPGERIIQIKTYCQLIATKDMDLTDEVRKCINDQFVHVIDPKAGPQEIQEKLNHIHGKPGIRC